MKYLILILALLSAPAHAARYTFDAYVETNRWICLVGGCLGANYEPLPTPEIKYGALEGATYSGFFVVEPALQGTATIWLNAPSGTLRVASLDWNPYTDRYGPFVSSIVQYLDFDLSTGLGKYFFEDDAYPYYRKTSFLLSNISEVPLPAGGVLLLSGLGALALGRRFKRAL